MAKGPKKKSDQPAIDPKRLREANKNWASIKKKIAPFVKRASTDQRRVVEGEWKPSSHLDA